MTLPMFNLLTSRPLPRYFWRAPVHSLVQAMIAIVVLGPASAWAQSANGGHRQLMAEAVRTAASVVLPSVVAIEVIGAGAGATGEVSQEAPTSGVIVDDSGLVLASNIVVRQSSASILVVLPDGQRYAADVVAQDYHRDLVLLRIKAKQPLTAIDLTSAAKLSIGQTTIAAGRYGANHSPMVSTGVLSAVDRLDGIALQTDARVSPSFYGAPLIDLYGNVLGILIPAIAEGGAETDTSWYDSGVAFAIPLDVISKNLARLSAGTDIRKGVIGIVGRSKDPMVDDVKIAAVRVRSPAEKSGIKAGDELVAVAGESVRRHQQVRQILGSFDAGDTIDVVVRRDGKEIGLQIVLADKIPPLQPQRLGILADSMDADADGPAAIEVSAVVPDSAADGLLQIGDVIVSVDGNAVNDVDSFRRMMITAAPATELGVAVIRDGKTADVLIVPDSIDGPVVDGLPALWTDQATRQWSAAELKLPDVANRVWLLKPDNTDAYGNLGLLVLLTNPGGAPPEDEIEQWRDAAQKQGVVVCVIAPEANTRWKPKEIQAITRVTAAVLKQAPIDLSAVAIGAPGALLLAPAEAADSMAIAVAIAARKTFSGVGVSSKAKPPAIRVQENEPANALQLFLPLEPEDELPSWTSTLKQAGYPVVRGGVVDHAVLLRWVRCLQAI